MSRITRCISILALFSLSICAFAQDGASAGEKVYKSKCVLCHGVDGKANTPMGKQLNAMSLLSDDVKNLSADDMKKTVSEGRESMPSFADQLSGKEIEQVVAYVRSLEKNTK